MSGRQSQGLNFQGINSAVQNGQSLNAGGVVKSDYGVRANRQGISGNAQVKIGGTRLGASASVNGNGMRTNVTGPKISVPRVSAPKIQTPKVSAPKISAPKVTISSPF